MRLRWSDDAAPSFVKANPPIDNDPHALFQTHITRPMKLLIRWGVLVNEMGLTIPAELNRAGQRLDKRLGLVVEIGQHDFCAGLAKGSRTTPGNRLIVGDADDQRALALQWQCHCVLPELVPLRGPNIREDWQLA